MNGTNYTRVREMVSNLRTEWTAYEHEICLNAVEQGLRDIETEASNRYYKMLNERFDERCKELTELGYVHKIYNIDGCNLGAFVGKFMNRNRVVSCGVILYAEERAWQDCLKSAREFIGK